MEHDNTEIISEEIAERFKYALEYLKKNFGETQNSIASRMKIVDFPQKNGHGYAVILSLNSTGVR
ncbi:hypothetical protein [Leptospira alexanderi]|uniref:hypothetical protein n=1 Tax=Leptospira alexanderi TaxID=100053 RepID=UPI0009913E5F|nr:hypothetical protein [Leptospira alexanderi]